MKGWSIRVADWPDICLVSPSCVVGKVCFNCNESNHIIRNCPYLYQKGTGATPETTPKRTNVTTPDDTDNFPPLTSPAVQQESQTSPAENEQDMDLSPPCVDSPDIRQFDPDSMKTPTVKKFGLSKWRRFGSPCGETNCWWIKNQGCIPRNWWHPSWRTTKIQSCCAACGINRFSRGNGERLWIMLQAVPGKSQQNLYIMPKSSDTNVRDFAQKWPTY